MEAEETTQEEVSVEEDKVDAAAEEAAAVEPVEAVETQAYRAATAMSIQRFGTRGQTINVPTTSPNLADYASSA